MKVVTGCTKIPRSSERGARQPTIRIKATVRGSDRKYVVINRKREHADRFCVGRDVSVQGAGA